MTNVDAWLAYFRVQGRLESIRVENMAGKRKRRALFSQLRATTGLKTLSLVNVPLPCTGRLMEEKPQGCLIAPLCTVVLASIGPWHFGGAKGGGFLLLLVVLFT